MKGVSYTAYPYLSNQTRMEYIRMLLKGRKTYICATLGAVVVFLQLLEIIDAQTANTLLTLLGFGGLAALHAKK